MRALLVLLVACNSPASMPAIESVAPHYGPLVGGTRIAIAGKNFVAGPTRVFVGGRETPLATALDEMTIEAVIPPGDRPGDVELVVLNDGASVVASGVFRYSTEPSIASVAPADVVFQQETIVTVTGSGFLDEAAGEPMVVVDGTPIDNVTVLSDTELAFVAPTDRPLGKPRIEISNARGYARKERAFRYRPTAKSGLLLFPRFAQPFAIFYDPRDNTRIDIPRINTRFINTVIVGDDGELWAVETATSTNQVGRLDLATQRLEQTLPMQTRISAMARAGDTIYAFNPFTTQLGTFDLDVFTPIGESLFPQFSNRPFGLGFDGSTLYLAYRDGANQMLATIDRATGVLGTPITVTGAVGQIEELRFFAGILYATTRNGTLIRIDLETNAATLVANIPRVNAMEVFE